MVRDRSTHLIVVLDDDPANLLLIERIFANRSDVDILTESDGRRSVDLVRGEMPDLVLLDLNLRGCNGDEILRQMRADSETADIPVVIISGDVAALTKQRMLEAGAQAYLDKPIVISEIVQIVNDLLGGHSSVNFKHARIDDVAS